MLKSFKDFLELAYQLTNIACGSNYVTLAFQPMIYHALIKLGHQTESGTSVTGFTTPTVKQAASSMMTKLMKYQQHMNNNSAKIALFLDPRRGSCEVPPSVKEQVRDKLIAEYGKSAQTRFVIQT